jgi:hypothetical protein
MKVCEKKFSASMFLANQKQSGRYERNIVTGKPTDLRELARFYYYSIQSELLA